MTKSSKVEFWIQAKRDHAVDTLALDLTRKDTEKKGSTGLTLRASQKDGAGKEVTKRTKAEYEPRPARWRGRCTCAELKKKRYQKRKGAQDGSTRFSDGV